MIVCKKSKQLIAYNALEPLTLITHKTNQNETTKPITIPLYVA